MKFNNILVYISEDEFEELVNSICQDVLGFGTVSFTKGPDGGKDGRFTGKANKYPSVAKPWDGKVIIQAKHTTSPVAMCSDGDFYTNKSSVINKEIERIKKIKSSEGLDYYLIFTNRKYTGGNDKDILKHISTETGLAIDRVAIIGIETINTLISDNKKIQRKHKLNNYIIPFDFSNSEIKEIISVFKKKIPEYEDQIGNEVEAIKREFDKVADEIKNAKNKLGSTYYEEIIIGESITYFNKIDKFLADPINDELKDMYYDTVSELRDLIIIKREEFGQFEEIFTFIYNLVCSSSEELKGRKRFVNIFLHYMYHTCSIGIK